MKRIFAFIIAAAMLICICVSSASCMQLDDLKEHCATIDRDTRTIEYKGQTYKLLPFGDRPYDLSWYESLYIAPADVPVLVRGVPNGNVSLSGRFITLSYEFFEPFSLDYSPFDDPVDGIYCVESLYDEVIASYNAPRDTLAIAVQKVSYIDSMFDSSVVFSSMLIPVDDQLVRMTEETLAKKATLGGMFSYGMHVTDFYICNSTLTFGKPFYELCVYRDDYGNVAFGLCDYENGYESYKIDESYNEMLTGLMEEYFPDLGFDVFVTFDG